MAVLRAVVEEVSVEMGATTPVPQAVARPAAEVAAEAVVEIEM